MKLNYQKMWEHFKEVKMRNFVSIYYTAVSNPEDEHVNELTNRLKAELERMDQLDNTKEFEILLYDLEKGTK